MPSFKHGKNTRVLLDQYDLTGYFNNVQLPGVVDVQEVTPFGGTTANPAVDKQYVVGLSDSTVTLAGMFDGAANAVDADLAAILGDDQNPDHLLSVLIAPAIGQRGWIIPTRETQYQVGAPISGIVGVQATMQQIGDARGDAVVLADVTQNAGAGYPFGAGGIAGADNGYGTGPLPLVSASMAGATATFSTAPHVHGFVAGQLVTVAGVTPAGYNTVWTVVTPSAQTFTATATGVSGLGAGSVFGTANGYGAGGGVVHVHLIGNTLNGTESVKVQHSPDNSTWTDLITLTNFPAGPTLASQRSVLAGGTAVYEWLRMRIAAGTASSGNVVMAAAFARR